MVSSETDKQKGLGWHSGQQTGGHRVREAAHTHHTAISGHREMLRFLLLQCKLTEDFESKDIIL